MRSGGSELIGRADRPLTVTVPEKLRYTPLSLELKADGYRDFGLVLVPSSATPPGPIRLVATRPFGDLVTFERLHRVLFWMLVATALGLLYGLKTLWKRYRKALEKFEAGIAHPAQVGEYRLGDRLGAGGMATVYEGRTPAGKPVAVKLMRRLDEETEETVGEYLKRFRREAAITARLHHPNIVHVLDFGDHDGVPYLVLERLQGETLAARIKQGALPLQTFRGIYTNVLEAVWYAHQQGIVHRDLKPSNIFVCARKPGRRHGLRDLQSPG